LCDESELEKPTAAEQSSELAEIHSESTEFPTESPAESSIVPAESASDESTDLLFQLPRIWSHRKSMPEAEAATVLSVPRDWIYIR
jgi:hypothetical protein